MSEGNLDTFWRSVEFRNVDILQTTRGGAPHEAYSETKKSFLHLGVPAVTHVVSPQQVLIYKNITLFFFFHTYFIFYPYVYIKYFFKPTPWIRRCVVFCLFFLFFFLSSSVLGLNEKWFSTRGLVFKYKKYILYRCACTIQGTKLDKVSWNGF